jgi:hypothetical protein
VSSCIREGVRGRCLHRNREENGTGGTTHHEGAAKAARRWWGLSPAVEGLIGWFGDLLRWLGVLENLPMMKTTSRSELLPAAARKGKMGDISGVAYR